MPLEYVYVAPGVTAVTDADGYFCTRAPSNATVYVYAENRPAVATVTPGSGSCESGGCAEVNLTITLPTAGDTVGSLEVAKDVMYAEMGGGMESYVSLDIVGSFLTFDPTAYEGETVEFEGMTIETEEFGECTVQTITFEMTMTEDDLTNDSGFNPFGGVGALDPRQPRRGKQRDGVREPVPGRCFQ